MNQYYTIGQLAKLAGISTKTLRVYERKGLLLPERNEENDYRIYGEEAMLSEQKRRLEKKREQLNTVIAHVDRAIQECKGQELDSDAFLKALGIIVKNQRADELARRLSRHADEPYGWSKFVFEKSELKQGMSVLDAGVGWGNL